MSSNFKGQDIKEDWQKQVDQCIYTKTVIQAIGQQDTFWEDHTDSSKKMHKAQTAVRKCTKRTQKVEERTIG